MPSDPKRCEAACKDGQPCQAQALPNSPHCWAHDAGRAGRVDTTPRRSCGCGDWFRHDSRSSTTGWNKLLGRYTAANWIQRSHKPWRASHGPHGQRPDRRRA